jgi:hypothetical protein
LKNEIKAQIRRLTMLRADAINLNHVDSAITYGWSIMRLYDELNALLLAECDPETQAIFKRAD